MTCWALFPVILSVTLVGPSLRFACLVSEASDAFREYFLLTQGAISPTHRKYYHQHSQHSFSANLCPAHHIQGVISFLITQGAYCPHSHFADEETEALKWDGLAQSHAGRGGVVATGLWMATEQESPAGSGRTDWWEGSQDIVGWRLA